METGVTQIPHAVGNFYDKTLLVRAVPKFLHAMFAQIRDIPRNNTDTIKFRRYGNLAAATTPLTEGVTPTGSQLSVTDITAVVQQYGDYVTFIDKVSFETLDPILTETSEILGDQAGDTLDQLTRDVLVAGTTVQYASTATARNQVSNAMVLNAAEIREAVLTLQLANAMPITRRVDPNTNYNTVPLDSCYVAITHPRAIKDLKNDSAWIPVQKYPSRDGVMEGEKGAIDEVRCIVSTNAKIFAAAGASSADVCVTIVLGQNAYGITRISTEAMKNIIKPLGSAGTADPLDQRMTSGWKATFVAVRLNETFMVRIEHGVSV